MPPLSAVCHPKACESWKAIEEGTAWIPPESPTQEGFTGRDETGENH